MNSIPSSWFRLLGIGAMALVAGEAAAVNPASSPSFRIDRASVNNGGAVQLSNGGTYLVLPQVVGSGAVGQSTSPSFALNHGRVGALVFGEDDIFVEPGWFAQGDVDAHPTVGLAGCRTPGFPLIFGVNAFNNIPDAVNAVSPNGRVILLNADFLEEEVVINKPMQIYGYDESLNTCTGLPGRLGAILVPSTDVVGPEKSIFRIEASNVVIRDLAIDGDNASFAGTDSEIEHGILLSDATGVINNLRVENVDIRNARTSGVQIFAPGTTGHQLIDVNVELVGDVLATGNLDGAAVRLGGASASVSGGTIRFAQSGIVAFGDGPSAPASLVGSGSPAVVQVDGVILESIGGLGLGLGPTSSRGAVALVANARGTISSIEVRDSDYGVAVVDNQGDGAILVSGSLFEGNLRVGVDLRDVAAVLPGESRDVVVAGNSFISPIEQAAIAVRNVGRNSVTTLEGGSVLIDGNDVSGLFGATQNPHGVFVQGVDPATGLVVIDNNNLVGLSPADAIAGIRVDSQDVLDGLGIAVDSSNVLIDRNAISGWQTGVSLANGGAPGAALVDARLGTVGGNAIASNDTGVSVGQNASVELMGMVTPDEVTQNQTGISASTTSSVARIRGAEISGNQVEGLLASNGANVLLEDSFVENGIASGSVGVRAAGGGATIDMGGGALGSSGGNVFNVLGTGDNWAVALEVAGNYRAELNEWQFNGVAFNGPSAIDDLIRDGDLDNPFAIDEAGTVGPLDFIPFVAGPLEAAITIDQSADRLAAGYGQTVFRSLGDAAFAVAPGGIATLLDGVYVARSYDDASDFAVNTVTLDRGATYAADNAGGAVIIPAVDGPGTGASDLLEAGSVTILQVAADDVRLEGLVVDGDSPALPSAILVGGAEINARNGIVLLGSAGDGPDGVVLDNVVVRNVLYRGLAMAPEVGALFEDLQVLASTFENIRGDGVVAPDSAAMELVDVRNSAVADSIISGTPVGLLVLPADDASSHDISANIFSDVSVGAIYVSGIQDAATVNVSTNTMSGGLVGVEVANLPNGGTVNISGNQIFAPDVAVLASGIGDLALVSISGNTLVGDALASVGVSTFDVVTSGPGTGVMVEGNAIQSQDVGVRIANALGADNTGTVVASNDFLGNDIGVEIEDQGVGGALYALVGGADFTARNTFDTHRIGIAIRGTAATADVRNNGGSAIPAQPAFYSQDTGILVDAGAAAVLEGNYIVGSTLAAINVRDSSEARLDLNNLPGDENQLGVLIESNARASLGPGSAPALTSPFFGVVTDAAGLNRFRNYSGLAGNFAIENTSILDQNAENNDFGTLDTGVIELVVEHQPDNGQGLVFFDPPSNQFLSVGDWSILQLD